MSNKFDVFLNIEDENSGMWIDFSDRSIKLEVPKESSSFDCSGDSNLLTINKDSEIHKYLMAMIYQYDDRKNKTTK